MYKLKWVLSLKAKQMLPKTHTHLCVKSANVLGFADACLSM
jgi:hypothetical protein